MLAPGPQNIREGLVTYSERYSWAGHAAWIYAAENTEEKYIVVKKG